MSQPSFCSHPGQTIDSVTLFHFSHSGYYIILFHRGFILPSHGDCNEAGHVFIRVFVFVFFFAHFGYLHYKNACSYILLIFLFGCISFFAIVFSIVYFRETDRQSVRAGEGQRERETQNPKQAPGSKLSAWSPKRGLNS